jgi:hypothetical protein
MDNLPPGCTDHETDPESESDRERRDRIREEVAEDRGDAEDRGQ